VFIDSILLRKDISVRHLLHCGLSFRDNTKGLSRAYVDSALASLSATATAPSHQAQPSPQAAPDALAAANDKITLGTWLGAVKKYKDEHKKKKGDALPRRMGLLLEYLEGATSDADLKKKHDTSNLYRDLGDAKKRDVPKLMSLYPGLPPLSL